MAYLGFSLLEDVFVNKIENGIIFAGFAVVFIIVGGVLVVRRGKDLLNASYYESDDSDEIEDEENEESIEAIEASGDAIEESDEVKSDEADKVEV